MSVVEMAAMPICRFRSFQDTPILYFTLRVMHGLPLLVDEAVTGILRKAWLHSALRERWFVGAYCIQPDRVTLFASPALPAVAASAWLVAWQEVTARQINEATRGGGALWAGSAPPFSVASEDDYLRMRAVMAAEASGNSPAGPWSGGREGMIWQLLPSGEPAATRAAPLALAGRSGSNEKV